MYVVQYCYFPGDSAEGQFLPPGNRQGSRVLFARGDTSVRVVMLVVTGAVRHITGVDAAIVAVVVVVRKHLNGGRPLRRWEADEDGVNTVVVGIDLAESTT